jgi:hypothetical protein
MMPHSQEGISLEVELQAVKEELDLARKARDRYGLLGAKFGAIMREDLNPSIVTKLYDELDTLRNGICNTCKTKFVPGAASSSSAGRISSSSSHKSIPLWRRMFQGRPSPQPISNIRDAEISTKQSLFEPSPVPPATQPETPAAADNMANAAPVEDDPEWSVVHNHEVRQTLNVHLAHTIKLKSGVNCVKFSRAGRYLAVGLSTGETYIYDVKTLSHKYIPF